MTVGELVEILMKLEQDKEIRYDSYEFTHNFEINDIAEEKDDKGNKYYCIF